MAIPRTGPNGKPRSSMYGSHQPDLQVATKFLRLLDPHAEIFTLQTFDDASQKRKEFARIIHARGFTPELLQLHCDGAGVFVTVNATDGKGRKTGNVVSIRAVWQEDDDGFEGEFPLEPSMTVETSPGHYHRYWLIADEWPADEQGRADFNAVMARMVADYLSDKSAKDLARVLRVPGFYHRKGMPHLVQLVAAGGARYTREEILKAFPPFPEPNSSHFNGHRSWRLRSAEAERIQAALGAIPSDDRETWLHVGMALKCELRDGGFDPWRQWAMRSAKWEEQDGRRVWQSIKPDGGVTIATLFGLAREHGWRDEQRSGRYRHIGSKGNGSDGGAPGMPVYVARCALDIHPEPVDWLWHRRIARGKLNLLAGDPCRGKSQLLTYMSANVSTGADWPDGAPCPRGSVILLTCEDDAADTIVPRLSANGADLSRVHFLDAVMRPNENGGPAIRTLFDLRQDLERLEAMVRNIGDVALIGIDPISAYLGGLDSHKTAEVRGALAPLQELAARTKAAITLVAHLNKSVDASAMRRVSGSGSWVAVCRSAWLAELDPQDHTRARRILTPLKNNIGDDKTGFAFKLESVALGDRIESSRVVFEAEPITTPADELLRGLEENEDDQSALTEAKDFLREYLSDGPKNAKAAARTALEAGIADRTLRRAKSQLKIRSKKSNATGQWVWVLPGEDGQGGQGGQDFHDVGVGHLDGQRPL